MWLVNSSFCPGRSRRSPRGTAPGSRISFDTEMPESLSPSSPPSRFFTAAAGPPTAGRGVQRVGLAELRLQLADLHQQAAGQRREGQEPFLDLERLRATRRGRSRRARTGSTTAWKLSSASCSCSAGAGSISFLPAAPSEVADHRDVGVEDLRHRAGVAVDGQGALRPARACRACRDGGLGCRHWRGLAGGRGRGRSRRAREPVRPAGTGRRRRRGFSRPLCKPGLERREPGAVAVANRVELLPQPLRALRAALPGRQRPWAGAPAPPPGHGGRRRKKP